MSNSVPAISAAASAPASASDPPKPVAAQPPAAPPRPPFSPTEVAYVKSMMGVMPAQNLEILLLKTGIPLPVNLGHGADTSA